MNAVVYDKYGPPEVLYLKDIPKPVPGENEVLIKIRASTVTTYDCWMRSSTAPPGFWLMSRLSSGLTKPNQPVLGTDLTGEIEAVGQKVNRFKPGDQIYAFLGEGMGGYAEYKCLPDHGAIAIKPQNMSFEEAAAIPQGALTALYFLRKAGIQGGSEALVFGASGGVGNYAVQLAKHFGSQVTGVCSTAKMEFVRSLGADHVIDYTREDFTGNGKTYDIIFDTVGKTRIPRTRRSLAENGRYVFATFGLPKLLQMVWLSKINRVKVIFGLLEESSEDLDYLRTLAEAGKLKAVVDRTYPLEQAAEAHKYVETGQKMGSVVLTIGQNGKSR
jgi:NADPH:quinone reductase-like Zn-dependent oxidoreductase